jgi:glycosyltransferase involved in cell wall biosynthesis
MMAAKPVVHAVDAANDPVREAGCGISVCPDDPVAIAEALRRVASFGPAEREAMGAKGRAYVLANHDYRVLAGRFVEALAR